MGAFAAGYADARRAVLHGAAALVDAGCTRLGLLGSDLEVAAHALAVLLATVVATAFLVLAGMVCAAAALLLWVEPPQRPALLAVFALLALAGGAFLARTIRSRGARPSTVFAATMDELALDRDALRSAASRQ